MYSRDAEAMYSFTLPVGLLHLLTAELGLQEKFESNTNDVTNQTVSFPIGTRNIRIEIVSTNDIHLDTFDSDDIYWSFVNSHGNSEWPEGVLVYSNYLEFQNILTSREQEGRYTVKVGNFSVYFMFRIAGKHWFCQAW